MICLFIVLITYKLTGYWIILRIFLIIISTFFVIPTLWFIKLYQAKKKENKIKTNIIFK
ncbi:hypothetical protein [Mesomycoplasma molare]|uniref:hypothetical protein n=1 Tax=Mesomycoplasma molare TaxID=171288 RepID=UPI000A683A5E|nr:hypothetical protein [Mesomycoplasma molare]